MQFNADVSCFTAIAFNLECDGRDGRPSIRPSFKRLVGVLVGEVGGTDG